VIDNDLMTLCVLQYANTQKSLKNYFKRILAEACLGRQNLHIFVNFLMQPLENAFRQL